MSAIAHRFDLLRRANRLGRLDLVHDVSQNVKHQIGTREVESAWEMLEVELNAVAAQEEGESGQAARSDSGESNAEAARMRIKAFRAR